MPVHADHYEGRGEIKSVTPSYDIPTSQKVPCFRFPSAGRVVAAYFTATNASSGTNLLQVGLRNGGVTGAGTIITAPQSSGTVLAGSAYTLTVATGGPEVYAAGEWVLLDVTTTEPVTGLIAQIDYYLTPTEPPG